MGCSVTAMLATVLVLCALTALAVSKPVDDDYMRSLMSAIDQLEVQDEPSKRAGVAFKRLPAKNEDTLLRFGRAMQPLTPGDVHLRFGRAMQPLTPGDVHLRFGRAMRPLAPADVHLRFGKSVPIFDPSSATSLRFGRR